MVVPIHRPPGLWAQHTSSVLPLTNTQENKNDPVKCIDSERNVQEFKM